MTAMPEAWQLMSHPALSGVFLEIIFVCQILDKGDYRLGFFAIVLTGAFLLLLTGDIFPNQGVRQDEVLFIQLSAVEQLSLTVRAVKELGDQIAYLFRHSELFSQKAFACGRQLFIKAFKETGFQETFVQKG